MLSSRVRRFWWRTRPRRPDPPLFRLLAERWRPLIRAAPDEKRQAIPFRQLRNAPKGAIWNPWMWIK